MLWSLLSGAVRLFGEKERIFAIRRRMALPMAVVISVGHMSKGLAKFVSWSPFVSSSLRDPIGLDTLKAIAAKTLPAPEPLLGLSSVAILALVAVLVRLLYAMREHRLANAQEQTSWRGYFPVVALATLFGAIIVGWMVH